MNEAVEEVTEEVSEVEENDLIFEAFNDAAGEEEDDVKLAMIGAGATFKNVTRLFNQYMIDSGQAMTKEAKSDVLDNILTGADLSTEEGLTDAIVSVTTEVTGASDKSAAGMVRQWAKKNDIEFYKKPKGTGSGATRNPFVINFHNALVENPNMTEDGLKDVIADLTPEQQVNPTRWFSQHNTIRKMANRIAEKLS